jgi:hypothetical protein
MEPHPGVPPEPGLSRSTCHLVPLATFGRATRAERFAGSELWCASSGPLRAPPGSPSSEHVRTRGGARVCAVDLTDQPGPGLSGGSMGTGTGSKSARSLVSPAGKVSTRASRPRAVAAPSCSPADRGAKPSPPGGTFPPTLRRGFPGRCTERARVCTRSPGSTPSLAPAYTSAACSSRPLARGGRFLRQGSSCSRCATPFPLRETPSTGPRRARRKSDDRSRSWSTRAPAGVPRTPRPHVLTGRSRG